MNNLYAIEDLKKYSLFNKIFFKIVSFVIFVFIINFCCFEVLLGKESFDEKSLEDILSGFDDDEEHYEKNTEIKSENREKTLSSLFGNTGLRFSYSYNEEKPEKNDVTDWRGINKLQTFLSLKYDLKFGENWKSRISGKVFYDFVFGLKGRENFSQEVLDDLEKEAEFQELYLEGILLKNFDIKIGKQIVVWGVTNSLRVVDVLNPTDNRELGMADLEDTRIPINMTRLDYYFVNMKLEAVAIHEIKFNKSAPYGSDFNPADQKINEVIPESNAENTEYGLAIVGIFSGWDVSLHWADFFNDNAHYKIESISVIPGIGSFPNYEMHHSRLNMIGLALSIPSGNYLWKAESAKLEGIEFALVQDKTFSRLDLLFGVEYFGFSNTSISIESGFNHIYEFDSRLENPPDSELEDNYATSVSFVQDYLNHTLNFSLSGMMIGKRGQEGGINRASLEYDVFDAFSLKGGLIIYQPGNSDFFKSLNGNDRFFSEIRYSF